MNILIFDIETKSNEHFVDLLPEPELKKVPSNYKDLSKIAAFEQAAKEEQKQKALEQVNRMPLDVDFARICCIGMAGDYSNKNIFLCHNEDEERDVLKRFWEVAYKKTLIGYNICHFDLPIIIRRSLILGVKPSFYIDHSKIKYSDHIIDLMLRLYSGGYVTNMDNKKPFGRKQEVICKILGIDNPLPGVDGSMVAAMTDEELIRYNGNDIYLLQRLAKITEGYYW